MMIISAIAAIDKNRAIGRKNELMWHLPADLRMFKQTTAGHTVIMGRKTMDSLGKPLPKRTNMVITRQEGYRQEGAFVFNTIEEAIESARQNNESEAFILGGGEIYRQTLPLFDKMYLSQIDHAFEGADTWFPEFNRNEWELVTKMPFPADENNPYSFNFCVYQRKKFVF